MMRKELLIFFLFATFLGEPFVVHSEALCNLEIASKVIGAEKMWAKASPTCCGEYKLIELYKPSWYHCLDECYTMPNCMSLYFDAALLQCLLFNTEEPSILLRYQYMDEVMPNSSSFIVSLNRDDFRALVRCITNFYL